MQLGYGAATAMGPACLTSVAIASKHQPGSSIVVCTDGLATIGLGKFGKKYNSDSEQFYNKIGAMAKEHGVTVSLISIKGAECNI